jgi:multiple sugar transport system permease protein
VTEIAESEAAARPTAARGVSRPGRMRSRRTRRSWTSSPYTYVALAFVYMAVFILYPMVRTIWESLTDTSLLNPSAGTFVGLANYQALLHNGTLAQSLYVTIMYVLLSVSVAMVLGVVCAMLVERVTVGRSLAKSALALPWAIPTIATGILFTVVLDPDIGIVDHLLNETHLPSVGWLTNNTLAFFSVSAITVWTLFPFVMLITISAMKGIPAELYDAVAVDGASAWSTFRAVTLPGIAPTLRVVTVLEVIWAFQQFQLAFVLTGGGPVNGTNFLVINLYKTAFDDKQLGMASAIGVVGLLLASAFVVVYLLVERRARAQ